MSKLKQTEFHKVFPAELKKNTLIVSPMGDSVSFRDSDIEKEIKTIFGVLDSPEVRNLVIDLSASNYFGTTMIGAFNALATHARDAGGRIALCGVSDDMLGILSVMNLDSMWPRYGTRKEAIKAVAG